MAALLVFGNHVGDAFLSPESRLNGILQTGWVGVSFFFLLSGFVLTWSARPDDRLLSFYRRRAARIMPNHVVLWAVYLVVVLIVTGASVGFVGAIASLTLLHAWHPSEAVHFAVNGVAWSLSVEVFFYAMFPLFLPALRRLESRGRRLAMGFSCLAVLACAALGYAAWAEGRHWLVYVFPLARLPEFVLGVLLALEVRHRRSMRASPVLMLCGAVMAWVACQWVPPAFQVASVTLVPFALLIMAAATADLAGHRSLLRHRTLVRLGEWSFAFYLVHPLVITVADHVVDLADRAPGFILVGILLLLALSVAASAAVFTVLEKPLERRLRGERRWVSSSGGVPPALAR